jgi:hypothetical protein
MNCHSIEVQEILESSTDSNKYKSFIPALEIQRCLPADPRRNVPAANVWLLTNLALQKYDPPFIHTSSFMGSQSKS